MPRCAHEDPAAPDDAPKEGFRLSIIDVGPFSELNSGFVTDFGPILSLFFRDPDGLECEVCVENPDAEPGRHASARDAGGPLLRPVAHRTPGRSGVKTAPNCADTTAVIDDEASARFAGRLSAFLYLLSGAMLAARGRSCCPVPPRRRPRRAARRSRCLTLVIGW